MMKKKLYLFAKCVWHATYIRIRDYVKQRKYQRYWSEHKTVRWWGGGKYSDKTFYVIRRTEAYTGLFSDFVVYTWGVKHALDAGYIPVIDMQTTGNMYLHADQIGKVNAWEYFFKQPCGYSMIDIAKAKNVIWGAGCDIEIFPWLDREYLLNRTGDFHLYQEIVKQYIHLSDEAEEIVDSFYKCEFTNEKVLGVLCRGTDYISRKPEGHPIQPSVESVFKKVDEVIRQYQCTKIFLGTEDAEIYAQFQERYQNNVITNRKNFVAYEGNQFIGNIIKNNMEDLKEEGMEYLATIALLARCDCFVGGHTSGTVGVMLLEHEFEYSYIFELGLYPQESKV